VKRVVIIGAGGQAREVRWMLDEINRVAPSFSFAGYVISDPEHPGAYDSVDEIVGDFAWLRANRGAFDTLALGIGTAATRLKLAAELERDFGPESWPPLVHPSVILDRATATLGHGTLVCPGVVATVNVTLAPYAMLNFGCTVGHEARIGRGSVVMPGANISGGVTVGDGVLVGTGAQILQYRRVGDGATVGAGAVVTRDVAAGKLVIGIPARERNHEKDRA
jgi:sugar O-acyltransferase (sialic acid O-acetyltransferase NeuD family)